MTVVLRSAAATSTRRASNGTTISPSSPSRPPPAVTLSLSEAPDRPIHMLSFGGRMSRAFVKETAESAAPPERMVDDGPNLVTLEGLAQIDAHIARIEASLKTDSHVLLRETPARDLALLGNPKSATAEVVPPSTDDKVSFGSTVTIQRQRPHSELSALSASMRPMSLPKWPGQPPQPAGPGDPGGAAWRYHRSAGAVGEIELFAGRCAEILLATLLFGT